MPMLSNTIITTALTAVAQPALQLRPTVGAVPWAFTAQATFTYGSAGTTATAWIQTSLDGGATWNDVFSFGFTTASLRKLMSVVQAAALVPITLQDGALAINTAIASVIGPLWRTKLSSTGTYAGGTTLRVDIGGFGFTSLA